MGTIRLVAGALAALALALLGRRRWTTRQSKRRERPVLPAHYSTLLQADRTHYPGRCSACGTENTPGYDFCKECGERLSGGTGRQTDTDVSQIFKE